jgi:hypothetical protein
MVAAASAASTQAQIVYQTQERSVAAFASFGNIENVVTAPGFGPFVEVASVSTDFPEPQGTQGTNSARAGIDCHLDPDMVTAVISLAGAGGLSSAGGTTDVEFGNAMARVNVGFSIDAETPLSMLASPRPSNDPGDRFKLKLSRGGVVLFALDETSPPQSVSYAAMLQPGSYQIELEVELTATGPLASHVFTFSALVPAPASPAVLAMAGLVAARRRRQPIGC